MMSFKQTCPFCLKTMISLYGHQCTDLPPNFEFQQSIETATFFDRIYQESNAISKQGKFDEYKLNPMKYQVAFLKAYQSEIDNSIQTSFKIAQPALSQESFAQNRSKSSSQTSQNFNLKHICPYCFQSFPNISHHQCPSIPKDIASNFTFQENICTHEFFIFLYKKLEAWSSTKNVDLHKLDRSSYPSLFFKYYNRMVDMGEPSLDQARIEKNYPSVSQTKSRYEEFEKDLLEKAQKNQSTVVNFHKPLCPYCFQIVESFQAHRCENMPSAYVFDSNFDENLFFGDLYRKLRILTPTGKPDLMKINHHTFSSEFFRFYNQKLQKLHETSIESSEDDLESNLDLSSIDDSSFSDMDLLDAMSRDYDLHGTPEPSSKIISTEKLKALKIPPEDGMPWCFSCVHMMDCPKGVDSTQMESVFDCDDYENMNVSVPSLKPEISQSDVSICGICAKMMGCPLNLDSEQMEHVFQCHAYEETSSNRENREIAIQDAIERELEKEILMKVESKKQKFKFFKRRSRKKKDTESLGEVAEKDTIKDGITEQSHEEEPLSEDPQIKITDEEKQELLAEIMNRWKEERGDLKIFCRACETEMDKVVTTRKIFYRCQNFPECQIKADPWYISQAVKKNIVSHIEHGDLIVLYQYDDLKNIVTVSEIYSEGKLFL